MSKTAVVILHYKGIENTLSCISSLYQKASNSEVYYTVVVANSDGGIKKAVSTHHRQTDIIVNRSNLGFSGGNNIGISWALKKGCDFIILLNNDAEIETGLIERLTQFAGKNPQIGLISPKIYFAPLSEYHQEKYRQKDRGKVIWYAGGEMDWNNCYASHRGVDMVDRGQYDDIEETDFATGCCMLITRKVVEKIGLLDEKYFLYYEDVDYSLRARDAGFKIMYFPSTCLWHKNADSSGRPGSPVHIYYQTRNRLYLGYKYAPFMTKKSLFLESIRHLFRRDQRSRAVLDYYMGKMGKRKI